MGVPRGQGLAVFTETRREMNKPEVLLSWCASSYSLLPPEKGHWQEAPGGSLDLCHSSKEVGGRGPQGIEKIKHKLGNLNPGCTSVLLLSVLFIYH